MPNWIEGTIKLRGQSENLKRFFKEGLAPSSYLGRTKPYEDFVKCDFDRAYCEVTIKNEPHIVGTRRAFVQDTYVYWDNSYETIVMPIKQAWAFITNDYDEKAWLDISKKYDLDIRLYGFECGMEFCQEIEIIGGEVTIDNDIKYDDWYWECPMPHLGG